MVTPGPPAEKLGGELGFGLSYCRDGLRGLASGGLGIQDGFGYLG